MVWWILIWLIKCMEGMIIISVLDSRISSENKLGGGGGYTIGSWDISSWGVYGCSGFEGRPTKGYGWEVAKYDE